MKIEFLIGLIRSKIVQYFKVRSFLILLDIVICLLCSGCDNDIFEEGPILPEVTNIILPGDNGEVTTVFSTTELNYLSVEFKPNDSSYVKYFSKDGTELHGDISASELDRITFKTPLTCFSIFIDNNKLKVKSDYNARSYAVSFNIELSYSYATKVISYSVQSGEPVKITDISYNDYIVFGEDYRSEELKTTFTNNGDKEYILNYLPFLNIKASNIIYPNEDWANDLNLEMPVLSFDGASWSYENRNVWLGQRQDFVTGYAESFKTEIKIPAESKVEIFTSFNFTEAQVGGELKLLNKVSREEIILPFHCESVFPVSFEIDLK
ncbi:MAG: hypothetical protein K2J82_04990 [Muribaculaceae bacterium]|nr:hypothetical protein [Muribaculaceae bacterium]